MKITINKPTEINIGSVLVNLPVRYGTDDIPDDFPMRQGNRWVASIDIDTGAIADWPQGKPGELYMKVVDEGVYTLYDVASELVLHLNQEYVPHCIIPGEYGDYVHLIINNEGRVTNWKPNKAGIEALISTGAKS